VLQWLMFQMGGVGPMQGQAGWFRNAAPEPMPLAYQRYHDETRRLYGVLDARLAEVPFLGGDYSIADMATFPWVNSRYAGVSTEGFPNLERWLAEIAARPAVIKGLTMPAPG
jgi:GST-like protein